MAPLFTSVRVYRPFCGLQDVSQMRRHGAFPKYSLLSPFLCKAGTPSAKCTPERLLKFISEMRYFIDYHFGKNAADESRRRKLTLFPAHLFYDSSDMGSLFCMLRACFSYCEKLGVSFDGFEDEDDGKVEHYVALLLHVEKELKLASHIKPVKAFISPNVPEKEAEKIRSILHMHNAAILSTPDVATHVIYPDPPGTKEHHTDDQVLARLLRRDTFDGEDECFMHWYHHPDSYNDWVPEKDVLGHVFVPRNRPKNEKWHVQARWVRDLALYNEWMNELDYEMPISFNDYIGNPPKFEAEERRPGGHCVRVRLRLRVPAAVKSDSDVFRVVGLPSIDKGGPSKAISAPGGENENKEGVDLSDGDAGDCIEEEVMDEGSAAIIAPDDNRNLIGSSDKIVIDVGVFMPSFSAWFDFATVNDVERRALPEFFSGMYASKTESAYMDIRNFMVVTWRENPKSYVSGTAVRRRIAGDACSILRLHAFLEHWGLINYGCPEAGPPPSFNAPPRALPLHAGVEDDVSARKSLRLLLDDGSKAELENLKIIKYGRDNEAIVKGTSENALIRESDKMEHSSQFFEKPRKEPIEYHCDSCGVDCSKLRFHCATKADVDLCASCYQNGRYDASMKHRDFIQMNSTGSSGGVDAEFSDIWTESETLLLLEALELYGDNWTLVSEHVGSKEKTQCVVQFLRLPIEDNFIKSTTDRWWSEHPEGDVERPSPADIMRAAGASESALAAVAPKVSSDKSFSGKPLLFGDHVNIIVPFVSMISSLTTPTMLKEIMEGMEFEWPQRQTGVPLRKTIKGQRKDGWNSTKDLNGSNLSKESEQKALSSTEYDEHKQRAMVPADVLKTDIGEAIAHAAVALLDHGSITEEEKKNLKIGDFPCDILKNYESSNGFSCDKGDVNAKQGDGSDGQKCEQQQHDTDLKGRNDGSSELKNDVDSSVSSSAVAMTALIAACVTAAQRHAYEEMEIGRLSSICMEVRMALIRRKIKHLNEISEFDIFSKKFLKKQMVQTFSEKVKRKLQQCQIDPVSRDEMEEEKQTKTEENVENGTDGCLIALQTEQGSEQMIPKVSESVKRKYQESQSSQMSGDEMGEEKQAKKMRHDGENGSDGCSTMLQTQEGTESNAMVMQPADMNDNSGQQERDCMVGLTEEGRVNNCIALEDVDEKAMTDEDNC